jgi:DNA-binding MurR/RpiR family transcriptional regulator
MPKKPTADAQPRAIERRIKAVYDSIPGSERAVADRVLEFPGDIILCSATELAALAGASKAAVTRLIKRLGYGDYREMQREIRAAQMTGDPIFLTAGRISERRAEDSLHLHLEQDLRCLRETIETIDESLVFEVARRILAARRVVCLGFRNSHFFAGYARRQLILLHPNVSLMPAAGQMLMEDMADLGPDDLLFAIGLRRRPRQLRDVLELMRDRGVPIAYITDRRAVTTAKHATWLLPCQVRGTSLFDSYVGVVSLINFICTRAMGFAGAAGRERLRLVEDMLERLGELDPSN